MTPEQQFYLQLITTVFTGLAPIVLGAFGLWLRARFNKQDQDRAEKTADIKTHIDNATQTIQTPATLVEKTNDVSATVIPSPPTESDQPR